MNTKLELNEAVYEARSAMTSAGYRVDDVAALLRAVGLDRAAERLDGISEYLDVAGKNLIEAYSEDLGAQIKHGEEMTGSIIMAALQTASLSRPTKVATTEKG